MGYSFPVMATSITQTSSERIGRVMALIVVAACASPPAAPRTASPVSQEAGAPFATPDAAAAADARDDEAIARASQEYLDLLVELWPQGATAIGLHARDTEL